MRLLCCAIFVALVAIAVNGQSTAETTTTTTSATAKCVHGTAPSPNDFCTACDKGYSGQTCEQPCTCETGFCLDGPQGSNQCSSCWPGFFGPSCERCMCKLGMCDSRIDPDAGHCTSCFTDFLDGIDCDSCKPGRYGTICQGVCECVNGVCDAGLEGTGRCVAGSCQQGFFGHYCNSTQRSVTIPLSRTISLSLLPPTTETVTTTTNTPPPTTTTSPAGTKRPITAILLIFLTEPAFDEVRDGLSMTLSVQPTSIDLSDGLLNHSVVVKFVNITETEQQEALYMLLGELQRGSPDLGNLQIRGYQIGYTWDDIFPSSAQPTTQQAVILPPADDEKKGIAPGYVLLIVIGVLCLLTVILYGLWLLYVGYIKNDAADKRRQRVTRVLHNQHRSTSYTAVSTDQQPAEAERTEAVKISFPETLVPAEEEFAAPGEDPQQAPAEEMVQIESALLQVEQEPPKSESKVSSSEKKKKSHKSKIRRKETTKTKEPTQVDERAGEEEHQEKEATAAGGAKALSSPLKEFVFPAEGSGPAVVEPTARSPPAAKKSREKPRGGAGGYSPPDEALQPAEAED